MFHGMEKWFIGNNFYNGLLYSTRMTLDAAIRGMLMNYLQDIAYNLIEDMKKNHHSWGSTREKIAKAPQKVGLYEVSMFGHMYTKVDALYQKIENLSATPSVPALVFLYLLPPQRYSNVRYAG